MEKDSSIYYPMLLPDGDAYDAVNLWEGFNELPARFRDILTSRELPRVLMRIQEEYGLEDTAIEQISRLLRWLFFQKLTWDEFGLRVESVMFALQGNGERIGELLARIRQEILGMNPTQYQEEFEESEATKETQEPAIDQRHIRYLPLLRALSAYPELHHQRITSEKITIKGEREPVAPTIRYWLRNYRDELGVGQHSTVERGKFLFQGANTKNLSTPERETLALMIKSLEEEEPLAVDTAKKTIVFQLSAPPAEAPATETVPTQSEPPTVPQSPAPSLRFETDFATPEAIESQPDADGMTFSSGHRLPGEQDVWGGRNES